MRRLASLLFLSALLAVVQTVQATDCFFPDGTHDTIGVVCNQTNVDSGVGSSCCRQGDTCLADGSCEAYWQDRTGPPRYWYRQSCTDRDWLSPSCTTDCRTLSANTSIWILPCQNKDRSVCCHIENTRPRCDCVPFYGRPPNATSTSSAAASAPSVPTPTARSTLTVGLAVGLSLGIVMLVGAAFFVLWRRRVLQRGAASGGEEKSVDEMDAKALHEMDAKRLVEAPSGERAVEMEGPEQRYELEGAGRGKGDGK